jgi:hypothetical protein
MGIVLELLSSVNSGPVSNPNLQTSSLNVQGFHVLYTTRQEEPAKRHIQVGSIESLAHLAQGL